MRAARRTAFVVVVGLAVPALWAAPAFAERSLTVTPNSDLVDGRTVSVSGAGFTPMAGIAVCQAVDDGSPGPEDCAGTIFGTAASSAGEFSGVEIPVRQSIFVPGIGRNVNCLVEACFIGAAEPSDLAGTAVFARLTFVRVQPDGRIRRLRDGAIFGNDVYNDNGRGQTVPHAIVPGGNWSYAVEVENDGGRADDITITAAPTLSSPDITVRYFAGYFDVTSFVTGTGFTFGAVPPGGIRRLSVRFVSTPGAPIDSVDRELVTFRSGAADFSDAVLLGARVLALT